jgi:hypothetical protein
MNGICTLANDRVYHQLVALLNSIEAQMGTEMPVCIYPYDDKTERIAAEIANRPNVQLYRDRDSIAYWDQFARQAWDAHPTARQRWGNADPATYYRVGTHRRFCAFDAPFDRFLYMDADTLLLNSVEFIFNQLEGHDWITYDFQFRDLSHVYDDSLRLRQIFSEEQLRSQIFCSGFYASKQNLFDRAQQNWLLSELEAGDAAALYPMAPDQTLLNYMVMKSGVSNFNLALELPPEQRSGCCVTSPDFTMRDWLLFDHEAQLTYLHFIGLSSSLFNQLCDGENIDFPYRDIFLHYRYLHEPENRPQFSGQPRRYNAPPSLPTRLLRKLGLVYR